MSSWFVGSDHVETLHNGLMVGPGEDAPDVDPELDKELIERGALISRDPEPDKEGVFDASPTAIALATEHAIDLAEIVGTGSRGRIVEKDVKAAIDAAAEPGGTPENHGSGGSAEPETAASPQEEVSK